ncbi:MAG: glycosyltransferase [Bacteroidota bacterium]
MITYNHEKFIREAIDGVLMQETNFEYELIIANDCSTDNTDLVIQGCINKYLRKNSIKYLNHKENKGIMLNFISALQLCKGKYIALCEGDDYWTNKHKLQKQVDFLENNLDFAICFHNARKLNQTTGDDSELFFTSPPKEVYTITDIIKENFIPTLTSVFRNNLINEFPDWYYKAFPGDWPLHILNSQFGKIKYIDEIMAVYRMHDGGSFSPSKNRESNYERCIKTFVAIEKGKEIKHKRTIAYTISNLYFELFIFYIKEKRYTKAIITFGKCLKKYPFNILKVVLTLIKSLKKLLWKRIKK